jgi:hypothetical protein
MFAAVTVYALKEFTKDSAFCFAYVTVLEPLVSKDGVYFRCNFISANYSFVVDVIVNLILILTTYYRPCTSRTCFVTVLLTFRDVFQARDPPERRGVAVDIKLPLACRFSQ